MMFPFSPSCRPVPVHSPMLKMMRPAPHRPQTGQESSPNGAQGALAFLFAKNDRVSPVFFNMCRCVFFRIKTSCGFFAWDHLRHSAGQNGDAASLFSLKPQLLFAIEIHQSWAVRIHTGIEYPLLLPRHHVIIVNCFLLLVHRHKLSAQSCTMTNFFRWLIWLMYG